MHPSQRHTEPSGQNPRSAPTSRSEPGSRHEPITPLQVSGLPTIPAQGRPSGGSLIQVMNLLFIQVHTGVVYGCLHGLVLTQLPVMLSPTRLPTGLPMSSLFLPAHLSSGAETTGPGRYPRDIPGSQPPSPLNLTICDIMDPCPVTGSLSAPSCPTNQNMEARIILNSPLFFASLENA